MLQRLFGALLAFVLMAGIAWAGYNIRQNADGSTDWVSPTENFSVGQQSIPIVLEWRAAGATAVIPMAFSGSVREVLASRNVTGSQAVNVTTILQFWRLRAASRGDFALLATWTVGDGALGRTATPSGNNYLHLSTTGPHTYAGYVVRTGQITALNTFAAGDSLAVSTTGQAFGTAGVPTSATIIFIIDRNG